MSRLGAALAPRIFFFAFLASWQDTMVEHFVSHYASLGIDLVARSNLTLHAVGGENAAAERRCARFLRAQGIPFARTASYSSAAKAQLANAYIRSLPQDALLMYPDLDEFFHLPCSVDHLAREPLHLRGRMVDRLAPRWACAPQPRLQRTPSIFEQFPARCKGVVPVAERHSPALGSKLHGHKDKKVVLLSVRDTLGRIVQYRSSHTVACFTPAELACTSSSAKQSLCTADDTEYKTEFDRWKREHTCSWGSGTEAQKYIPLEVSHFHFTHEAILLMWRKLSTYRGSTPERPPSDGDVDSDHLDPVHLRVTSNRSMVAHIASYEFKVSMFVPAGGGGPTQAQTSGGAAGTSRKAIRAALADAHDSAGFLFRPDIVPVLKRVSCRDSSQFSTACGLHSD